MFLRVLSLSVFALLLVDASCAGCGAPQTGVAKKSRGEGCGASAECGAGLQCLVVNGPQKCTDPNDLDGDGIPNAEDTDIDGDGIPNAGDPDVDGDGKPNASDPDPYGPNNDGSSETSHTCTQDTGKPTSCNPSCVGLQGDCDNDGVPNQFDNDDNGDGIPDGVTGAGSCDGGKTTTTDENHDCDGYCLTAEGGFQPCDDCPYPVGSEERNTFCANPGAGVPDSDGDGIPDPQDPDPTGTGQQPPPAVGEGEGEGEGAAGEGEGEGAGNCSTVDFNPGAANLEPRILFVVDKSGSMNDPDTSGTQKYQACAGAIEQVSSNLNGTIDMGLMHFPGGDPNVDACSQGDLDVNVGPNTAGQIANVLNSIGPGGGTPTAVTLLQAKSVLDALPSQGGPRAVVLATDGGPNCNQSLDGNTCRCVASDPSQCQNGGQANCLDDSNTINAAAQLNAAGYSVFVIGEVGSENFSDVLNSLATAGGTALAGSIKFYAATNGTDLVNDLEDIAVRVGACRIDVGQNVTAPQVTVTVDVNGQATSISQDTTRTNGWDLVDPHTVELFGTACTETVQGGAQATVSIQVCDG